MLSHGDWSHVALFPTQGACCGLHPKHKPFSRDMQGAFLVVCTQTLGHPYVFWVKGFVEGRIGPLRSCRTAFAIWHFPHAVPHTLGYASHLRTGKLTACRFGLSAKLFLSAESVVLSLTSRHTLWNLLSSAGQSGMKDRPFPGLSPGVLWTTLN